MKDKLKKQWFLCGLVLIFSLVIFDSSATLARAGIWLKSHNGSAVMIFSIARFSPLPIPGV